MWFIFPLEKTAVHRMENGNHLTSAYDLEKVNLHRKRHPLQLICFCVKDSPIQSHLCRTVYKNSQFPRPKVETTPKSYLFQFFFFIVVYGISTYCHFF